MFEFYDKDSLYPELKHMESPKVFFETVTIYTDICCFDLRAPFVTIKFNKKEMLPFQAGDILLEKLKIPENLMGDDLY